MKKIYSTASIPLTLFLTLSIANASSYDERYASELGSRQQWQSEANERSIMQGIENQQAANDSSNEREHNWY